MRKFRFTLIALSVCLILAMVAFPLAVSAAPARGTGLTAKIVAHSGQKISEEINAKGKDIGIYIGPGVHDVTVTGATVSGANDEGILVQDASNIVITNSTIKGNATNPATTHAGQIPPALSEDKAIVLAGSTNCLVKNNIVVGNGHGGISVLDDGANHPFALDTVTAISINATGNVITGNIINDNAGDCAIVVSSKNPGSSVSGTIVSGNTLDGDLAGIVVATGLNPSGVATTVAGTIIQNNVVMNTTVLAGITLHGFGVGVISGTQIINNVLSHNGPGEFPDEAFLSAGIDILAESGLSGPPAFPPMPTQNPQITGTQVSYDTVSGDVYALWDFHSIGTTHSNVVGGLFYP